MQTLKIFSPLLISISLFSGVAFAADPEQLEQQVDASLTDGEAVLMPPKLLEHVKAEYPHEAYENNMSASVVAELEVDETGAVVNVKITEPAGHGFDEAAKDAMMQFKFEPAKRGDTPIASLLMYKYNFFIEKKEPEPETVAPVEQPPATLVGKVTDSDGKIIPGALISLSTIEDNEAALPEGDVGAMGADGGVAPVENGTESDGAEELLELDATADSKGVFTFKDIPAGHYEISIDAPGFQQYYVSETMVPGESKEVIYSLSADENGYEVVVRGRRPPREVTRREITAAEITKLPGTNGDALRAVQNMPGTARAPMMGGEIIIRGSSPGDSAYAYDSLAAPWLYHFGGSASIINSDLLEKIDFYPGNFSVKYGRAIGGILDVTTRSPNKEKFHGYVDVDLWDASILAEGPINKNWSIAVSGRRSYIDGILSAIDMGDDFKMTVAPRYYDFQVIADYHPSEKNNLRLFFFGSDDKLVFIYDDESNPNREGGDDVHLMVYQGQAEWKHKFSDTVSNQLDVGFGYWGGGNSYGDAEENWNVLPLLIRDEVSWKMHKNLTLRAGTDTELRWGRMKMKVPDDYSVEGQADFDTSAHDKFITFKGNRFYAQPALYTELDIRAIPKTQLILGMRGDYYSQFDEWSAEPRLTARYELFDGTTLKGGLGLFHQAADYAEGDKDYGNPDLELERAIHASIGFEQEFGDNVNLSVEGFYKDLDNVITASDEMIERDGQLVEERFDNDGTGRVYGMEAQLKHSPTDKFYGWIAYTLSRSERKDMPGGPTRLFDYDQTHVLTAVGTYNFGKGWSVGARFRLTSGNPYTPVIGASYDADSDKFFPIYGKNNSKRMPLFHQLDLRIDKKWQWNPLALTVYLDVQNVYNHRPAEFAVYSDDYSEKDYVTGLPIIPSIGLKLEI